jgi:thiamine pyrophosphokinase
VRSLAARSGTVVAADGGANTCSRFGVTPDVIIGDLDSVTPRTLRRFRQSLLLYVDRQDTTDLEKAIEYLIANAIPEAVIVGADGRRVDFTLGNFSVLWKYRGRIRLTIVGDGWYGVPVQDRLALDVQVGTVVSILPFGPARGVTLRGFRYPLRGATLRVGEVGVSNEVRSRPASVAVASGALLVIVRQAWIPPAARRR